MTKPDEHAGEVAKQSRIQAALLLVATALLLLALPFALTAGKAFFLPIVTAIVITVALSPLADAFGRLGIPNSLNAALAVVVFVAALALGVSLIVQPAADLLASLPKTLQVIAGHVEQWRGDVRVITRLGDQMSRLTGARHVQQVVVAAPSVLEQAAYATPTLLFESILTLLMAYFMIESRVRLRRRLLLDRSDLDASLRVARALRDVQQRVGAYLLTVTLINIGVGVIVGLGAWAYGFDSPVMWGGIAALLNFLPYFGPLVTGALLGAVGLGTADTVLLGLLPALLYLGLHAVEANIVTPALLGRRFTVNPVAILVAFSFFSWVWGALGAILSIPLLIILLALFEHMGSPNVVGFLFGEDLFVGEGEEKAEG
ncbi:MAG TPA: AI-2E family transporter [Novosphingobium sp.]|jgi:predicted PurR-regulated permease PerM|nr:AI-2E family transporter [Novosphingobium sp.]HOA48558.1 AI-2E family transporter [Novosphingobium sp.]HPB21696.1 AI-2E family transporter [Novosphingobium sp.]HPZ45704.1 AI-2E family transporter [Novosphingobium sp.]HQD99523.1 AI-2E family transporter [Novosphingobium sp.]